VTQRLRYGPHPEQFGDLRLPAATGPHPVIIVIHGGFWRAAYDLNHVAPFCDALTAAGFATWNVEYRRLGNGGGWPETFEDVALAAQQPQCSPCAVAVGHSAGGHLALLLAHHALVAGAVSLAGVADLRRAQELNLSRGVVDEFLGGYPPEEASPAVLLPSGVPVRLLHGLRDEIVPPEISTNYVDRAKLAGQDAELLALPETGHFELVNPESLQWPEVYRTIAEISAMVCSSSSSVV